MFFIFKCLRKLFIFIIYHQYLYFDQKNINTGIKTLNEQRKCKMNF